VSSSSGRKSQRSPSWKRMFVSPELLDALGSRGDEVARDIDTEHLSSGRASGTASVPSPDLNLAPSCFR